MTAQAERDAARTRFLAAAGWGAARTETLAGDASARRYLRLHRPGGGTAVLMDAPPERGEDVRPFLRIGRHLETLGLSPPAILAEDAARGFLLLEDLGDDLYAAVLARAPEVADRLYAAAIDLLVALHAHAPPEGLAPYGPEAMAPLAGLAAEWYLPGVTDTPPPGRAGAALVVACRAALERCAPETPVLTLRDYHAGNLLWLPERTGVARVGLLDFQDAMAGHPAYDLVSLLRDARRDVEPALRQRMTARYVAATGHEPDRFAAACAALSTQRNLRILGVFARLWLRDGKPFYIDLIPRVWGHLQDDLAHPALAGLREVVDQTLPEPTPAGLDRLRARCPA